MCWLMGVANWLVGGANWWCWLHPGTWVVVWSTCALLSSLLLPSFPPCHLVSSQVPLQPNSSDCGIYLLHFVQELFEVRPLLHVCALHTHQALATHSHVACVCVMCACVFVCLCVCVCVCVCVWVWVCW